MQKLMDRQYSVDMITSWVQLYSDSMYSWALHKTSNNEVAEDLVQETFMAAVESISSFEGKSQPKTWLFSILNHKIYDYHRKSFRDPVVKQSMVTDTFFDEFGRWQSGQRPQPWKEESAHLLDDEQFKMTLQNCLQGLPQKSYSAIHLKYRKEKNTKVICQELDISPTNFWQIIHRAKLQLRKCLDTNWFNMS